MLAGRGTRSRLQRDVPPRARTRERRRRARWRGGVRTRAVPTDLCRERGAGMRRREAGATAARSGSCAARRRARRRRRERRSRSGRWPPARSRSSSASIVHEALCRRCADAGRLAARCRHRRSRADGTIEKVVADAQPDGAERAAGPLLPGMPNLHSHAFQRAIAGRTGRASADGDSFWTWRQAMYAFVDRVDADAFEAIADAGVCRDAEGGIHGGRRIPLRSSRSAGQAVCRSGGARAPDRRRRRRRTGIGLTLLPVFYAHAGFGGTPPATGQRRFVHTLDAYARLVATLAGRCRDVELESRRRAAQPARRDPGGTRRDRRARSARSRRFTSTPPSRRRRSRPAWPGAARGRSSGCSITPGSMRAGASCMRRT